jgi:hypothetical protein
MTSSIHSNNPARAVRPSPRRACPHTYKGLGDWQAQIKALPHSALIEKLREQSAQPFSPHLLFVFHDDRNGMAKFLARAERDPYSGGTVWKSVSVTEEIVNWLWDNDVVWRLHPSVTIAKWPKDSYQTVTATLIEFKSEADFFSFKMRWG